MKLKTLLLSLGRPTKNFGSLRLRLQNNGIYAYVSLNETWVHLLIYRETLAIENITVHSWFARL